MAVSEEAKKEFNKLIKQSARDIIENIERVRKSVLSYIIDFHAENCDNKSLRCESQFLEMVEGVILEEVMKNLMFRDALKTREK